MPNPWLALAWLPGCMLLSGLLWLGFGWVTGLFNPQGWLGVPPWRVPPEIRKRRW